MLFMSIMLFLCSVVMMLYVIAKTAYWLVICKSIGHFMVFFCSMILRLTLSGYAVR